MANRISHEQRKLIIRLLCEGASIRSIARVTGCHRNTVANVIIAFGSSSQIFLDDVLHDLKLDHIEATDLAFGPYATHGVLIRKYRNRTEPGNYAPAEMISAIRKSVRRIKDKRSGCTSRIDRQNLAVRTLMKRFNRLTLDFSMKPEVLECAVAMYVAFYNFVWRTRHTDYRANRESSVPPPR